MDIKTYHELILNCIKFNVEDSRKNPPYEESKYNDGDYTDGLNEGYYFGLCQAYRIIKDSNFLFTDMSKIENELE